MGAPGLPGSDERKTWNRQQNQKKKGQRAVQGLVRHRLRGELGVEVVLKKNREVKLENLRLKALNISLTKVADKEKAKAKKDCMLVVDLRLQLKEQNRICKEQAGSISVKCDEALHAKRKAKQCETLPIAAEKKFTKLPKYLQKQVDRHAKLQQPRVKRTVEAGFGQLNW